MKEVVEQWKEKKRKGKGVKLPDFLGRGADALVDNHIIEDNKKQDKI